MKITLTCIAILFSIFANAQFSTDTIFYNGNKKVPSRVSADFYRIYKKEADDKFYVEEYTMKGRLSMQGYFSALSPEKKEGNFIHFDENGKISAENVYIKNKLDGEQRYYKDGKLSYIKNYLNDSLHGPLIGYHSNGKIRRKEEYKNAEMIHGNCYTKAGADTSFYQLEVSPEFVGGISALNEFIRVNTIYPERAKQLNVEGVVYVGFTIDIDGSIQDVKILRGIGLGCDQETVRVIKSMPNWIPGKTEGELVKVKLILDINFKLM